MKVSHVQGENRPVVRIRRRNRRRAIEGWNFNRHRVNFVVEGLLLKRESLVNGYRILIVQHGLGR